MVKREKEAPSFYEMSVLGRLRNGRSREEIRAEIESIDDEHQASLLTALDEIITEEAQKSPDEE